MGCNDGSLFKDSHRTGLRSSIKCTFFSERIVFTHVITRCARAFMESCGRFVMFSSLPHTLALTLLLLLLLRGKWEVGAGHFEEFGISFSHSLSDRQKK